MKPFVGSTLILAFVGTFAVGASQEDAKDER